MHGEKSGIPVTCDFCYWLSIAYRPWRPSKAVFEQVITIPITLENCFGNKVYQTSCLLLVWKGYLQTTYLFAYNRAS